jgi:hypothetical protein
MKSYAIKTDEGTKNILADELKGYLVWPKSKIPFFDQKKLSASANREIIENLIRRAENGDEESIKQLWCEDYLSICYKVQNDS